MGMPDVRRPLEGGGKAKVLVVDDHPMVCYGLAQLINRESDLLVCGEAADRRQALAALEALHPDVAIVDIALGGDDGLALIAETHERWPTILLLALSMHSELLFAERAIRAGAHGYVTKNEVSDKILLAIRRVLKGGVYLSTDLEARLLERAFGHPDATPGTLLERLTERELQILRLIGSGRTTQEIALQLEISPKTVAAHREHLKTKLSLNTGAELTRYATLWMQRVTETP
jgi:DNA-binding NarL/FixJ family response regulator